MLNKSIENEKNDDGIIDSVEKMDDKHPDEQIASLEKEYSIYIHYKSHPASALASFSALVAVITFFAQLMTYIINKNVLEYWGYNISYASLGGDSLLYSAISAIVYGLILALSVMVFLKTSDAYFERKRYFLTVKYLLKKHKKTEKDNLKKLNWVQQFAVEDDGQFEVIKAAITKTSHEIEDLSKSIKKEQFLARLIFFKKLIPIIILSALADFVLALMIAQEMELWLSMIGIFIIQMATFATLYCLEQKSILKKKVIKKNVESLEPKELLNEAKCKTQYPLDNLRSKNKGIKNSTFHMLTAYALVMCIVWVTSFGISAKYSEARRKTFEVVNLEGQEYVVVHHNKDVYFLDKVSISDNSLTIFINHQRIISNSDISFTVRTFEKIIRDDS